MEPNLNKNQNKDDEKIYNDPLGFKENNTAERQNRFLSLRKNKKIRISMPKTDDEKIKEKYELKQNSFDASDNIIQNFFNSQEKTAVLYDLIANKYFNNMNIGNSEINLIKFIIVQCINYYKSEEDNSEALKNFFTTTILTNLIDIMNIFKQDNIIVYNISWLLEKLTYDSYSITKLITLNSSSLQKIFECISFTNLEVTPEVLKLIYNCYMTDEEAVNPNCNIGVYVFDSLNKYISENDVEKNKIFLNSPYFKILISFLDLLINDKTKEVYKGFDSDKKNNIIFVLLVLCRDSIDENLKLDSHTGLIKLLDIIKDENELDVSKFGICEIVSTFLPHIKLESNTPEIVLNSMKILDKFSYLCDIHEFMKSDLLNQIEQILITFVDMNENRSNPKLYYKNYSKDTIGEILNSISYIVLNSMADYDDPDLKNEWQDYIVNKTRIIEYLTLCLKINDIEEENLANIYRFFKDFIDDGNEKDRFLKLILTNFVEIGLVENLKNNIINKKFEVIQEILEISLMMLQQADKLKGNQINFLKVYLEKKGFVEMLNTIEGMDFGNQKNSELARNIRENFFK